MLDVLGLDLRQSQQGPAAFAIWLATTQVRKPKIRAVHVMSDAAASVLEPDVRDQLQHGALTAVHDALAPAELGDRLQVDIVKGGEPHAVLSGEVEGRAVRSLVIGRHAPTGSDRTVRLGSVARRLLRTLPAPIIVVPPELAPEGVGEGPVLLASDGRHDAERARMFATDLAERLGRPLVLAHVFPDPFRPGAGYVPATYVPGMTERYQQQQRERFEGWRRAQGLLDVEVKQASGPVVPRLLDIARTERACVLVTASRELTTLARLFATSAGSQLAAAAPCPVAVVPNR